MTILKKACSFILTSVMLLTLIPATAIPARAEDSGAVTKYDIESTAPQVENTNLSGEEIIDQINRTYRTALSRSGMGSFYNRCSQLVNWTTVILGIQTERYSGNGNQEYNLYENIDRTDCGYDVVKYSARDYSLEGALNAISENGTKDVYNIIIGWQSGSGWASSRYGHTCYIHAILDGNVYFYDSFGMKIGGTYYNSGEPVVCTIAEFAKSYSWGSFEGAVHFDFPDTTAPAVSAIQVYNPSEEGFTLSFYASDKAMADVYAKVWTYGNSEDEGYKIVPVHYQNGVAAVRINTADFGGFVGKYYVTCYAVDERGNVATTTLAHSDCVDLYTAESDQGTYRVLEDETGVYNAPYTSVNGADTLEYSMDADEQVRIAGKCVNDSGETWYQLEDGCWVDSETVKRHLVMEDVRGFVNSVLHRESSDKEV